MDDAGGLRRLGHRAGLFHRACEGLFANDVLARFCCGDGDFGMDVVGGADINHVDIRAVHHRAPVAAGLVKTEPLAGLFGGPVCDIDHHLAMRNGRSRPEEHRH